MCASKERFAILPTFHVLLQLLCQERLEIVFTFYYGQQIICFSAEHVWEFEKTEKKYVDD